MVRLVDRRTQFELRLHCRRRWRRFILFICSFVRPFRFLFHFIFIGGVRVSAVYGRIQRRRKYGFHSFKFAQKNREGEWRGERENCVCQFQQARPNWLRFVSTTKFWSVQRKHIKREQFSTQQTSKLQYTRNDEIRKATAVWVRLLWQHGDSVSVCEENEFARWHSISVQLSHPICLALFTFCVNHSVDLFCGTCSRLSAQTERPHERKPNKRD